MFISEQDLLRIAEHKPKISQQKALMSAAVAIILRDAEHGTEFLLMQRAQHPKDPWSGQMAFPGGKVEADDESSKAAAIREAHEEVGIQLNEQDYIGQLDDFYGFKANNKYNAHVACFVFKVGRLVSLKANYEVADMVWLPISHLDNPSHAHEFYHPKDNSIRMPAVLIDKDKEQILWGLSLRILTTMFELIDRKMRVIQNT